MSFLGRTASLPTLGIGILTEFGATDRPGALHPLQLRAEYSNYASFLEVGVETSRGLALSPAPGPETASPRPIASSTPASTIRTILLCRAERPVSRVDLEALTVALGGERDEAAAVVDGLVQDGLLQESV